jgi:hypothetical protein
MPLRSVRLRTCCRRPTHRSVPDCALSHVNGLLREWHTARLCATVRGIVACPHGTGKGSAGAVGDQRCEYGLKDGWAIVQRAETPDCGVFSMISGQARQDLNQRPPEPHSDQKGDNNNIIKHFFCDSPCHLSREIRTLQSRMAQNWHSAGSRTRYK